MNYGKRGIKHKKKSLNSTSKKVGSKFSVASIKIVFILAIAIIVGGSCLAFGAVSGIIASAPDINTIDVSPDGFASKIYDNQGNEIQALATSGSNRISVDIENIPLILQHAFVAIEDERFYEHNGIDLKGIFRAGMRVLQTGRLSEGGSTLTQQLLKNNYFNAFNETNIEKIKRKLQEQYLSIKLETIMDKATIMENYLNTINLGNGYYGVQAAANGYFGKDVSELTISECAVIASITQTPSNLNPVRYPDNNRQRQTKVLENMRDQGYISEEEYQEALVDDVYGRIEGQEVNVTNNVYSYFVDTLIDQIIQDLMEQKGYTETQATNLIYRGGLKINSTQDIQMQEIADNVINDPGYYPESTECSLSTYSLAVKETDNTVNFYSHYGLLEYFKNKRGSDFTLTFRSKEDAQAYIDEYKESCLANGGTVVQESSNFTIQPQMAFSLIDQHTGEVKVLVGGRGDKSGSRTFNRATDSARQPGSSIKPIGAYGPALDVGAITLASTIDDAPYYYTGEDVHLVKNYTTGEYRGLLSVREALKISQNVPAVKVLTSITPQVGFNYLTKFGLSTIVSPKEAINGNHDVVQSMALGGLTRGVKNIDICAAYAAIANEGTYIKPIYYTTVEDNDGNIILDNTTPETHDVLKKSTAWLLTDALQSVTSSGTGTSARLNSQPTAGKTGTTQTETDKWFCGYTPYYTGAIWLGYDDNSKMLSSAINHSKMWREIMEQIHNGLETGSFNRPDDIVSMEVCAQSGKLAVEGLCDSDPRGAQLKTEYFSRDNVPTETCDIHVKVTLCEDTDEIASTYCPHTVEKILIKKAAIVKSPTDEETPYTTWDQDYAITEEELSKVCTKHKTPTGSGNTNPTTQASTTTPTTPTSTNTNPTTRPSNTTATNPTKKPNED